MEPVWSFLLDNIWSAAALVALPVGGAFAQHIWSRWRNRLAELRWSATFIPLAFATDDFGWGKVEILYDGRPTRNLHVVNLHIQNASSRDLQNLQLDIIVDEGSTVLRSAGQIQGSLQLFPFAPNFAQALQRVVQSEVPPAEAALILRRSDFSIPVLNRGSVAFMGLLVSRNDHQPPTLTVGCDHPGVRIRQQQPAVQVWGVSQTQAVWTGMLVTIGISTVLALVGAPVGVVAAVAWTVGATTQHVGAATVRLARWLLSIFD